MTKLLLSSIAVFIAHNELGPFLTRISSFSRPIRVITRVKFSSNLLLTRFQRPKLQEAARAEFDKKLQQTRQEGFNEQLDRLAEPLGSLAGSSKTVYEGKYNSISSFNFIN